MSQNVTINQGEVYVKFSSPTKGKISFKELGMNEEKHLLEGGFLRMVFDFEGIGEHEYFKVPTIEVEYVEEVGETHWQCDFNEKTILDKVDNHGHSTIVLLDRKKMADCEHHHENRLVLHAEFPKEVHLLTNKCHINFFK